MQEIEHISLVFTFGAAENLLSLNHLASVMTPAGVLLPAINLTLLKGGEGLTDSLMPIYQCRLSTRGEAEQLRAQILGQVNTLMDGVAAKLSAGDSPSE